MPLLPRKAPIISQQLMFQPTKLKGNRMSTNDAYLAIFLGSKTSLKMMAWNSLPETRTADQPSNNPPLPHCRRWPARLNLPYVGGDPTPVRNSDAAWRVDFRFWGLLIRLILCISGSGCRSVAAKTASPEQGYGNGNGCRISAMGRRMLQAARTEGVAGAITPQEPRTTNK
jgi:hypothetical protein